MYDNKNEMVWLLALSHEKLEAYGKCNEECLRMSFNDLLRVWVLLVSYSLDMFGKKNGMTYYSSF